MRVGSSWQVWLLKTPKAARKSRVLGFAAVMSPACLSLCVPSSRFLPADSAVARFWNWRTSPCVISCTFFVASGRVGPGCSRSTACSGSGSTGYGRAVWTRWCWSSRQRSSNGTVRASACFGDGVRETGRPSVDREIRDLIRQMSSANPLWGAPRIHGELLKLGIEISQATVAKYMVRRRGTPSPTWRSFLRNQAARHRRHRYVCCRLRVVSAALCTVILGHDRRKIVHICSHRTSDCRLGCRAR